MHLFFSQIPFSSCSVILDYWSCLQNIRQEFFRQWIDYVINKIKSLGSEIYPIQKNLKSKHLLLLKAGHILLNNFDRIVLSKDRKSTRLNSSHVSISYAVFCLKKKKN